MIDMFLFCSHFFFFVIFVSFFICFLLFFSSVNAGGIKLKGLELGEKNQRLGRKGGNRKFLKILHS